MKILLVNYRYFVSGGPEQYMFALTERLEQAGHQVIPFSVRYSANRETSWSEYFAKPIAGENEVYFRDHSWSPATVVRGLERAFYAPDVRRDLAQLLAVAKPDVALVQHYLRKLSPSVLVALKEAGVPVVVRLSDFGMVCLETNMLRASQVCRRCITDGRFSGVRHRCVQGSLGVSAIAWAAMWFARRRGYFDSIHRFITPSSILREEMIAGGYDPDRIVVLPTFVDASRVDPYGSRDRRIVYAGRLSREKGVHVLLEGYEQAARSGSLDGVELWVAGAGDPAYESELKALASHMSAPVKFLGLLAADEVLSLLSHSALSLMPSLGYENLPNAVLESLAAGTPVGASNLGSMREILLNTDAGFLFRPGDPADLAGNLCSVFARPDVLAPMSLAARRLAETRYNPESHLTGLLEVLAGAVGARNTTRRIT